MNPNFNFDAEGVFDQPIKPFRNRKRKKRVRTNKYASEIAANRDRASIAQLMRAPKLLKAAMPRVMPDVDKLRDAGVTVGPASSWTKFDPPALRKELADFVGWSTAAGRTADDAEEEFFKKPLLHTASEFRKDKEKVVAAVILTPAEVVRLMDELIAACDEKILALSKK